MPINGLKRWHVYTLDYYSAIKKIISFAGIQRELKIILSKISQEDKYHMISLVCGGGCRKIVRWVLDERKRKGRKRTQEWKQEEEVGVIRVHSFYVCLELSQWGAGQRWLIRKGTHLQAWWPELGSSDTHAGRRDPNISPQTSTCALWHSTGAPINTYTFTLKGPPKSVIKYFTEFI